MDLVGYEEVTYNSIVADYAAFAKSINISKFTAFPISGIKGDNITRKSADTVWYTGPTLMSYLETVEIGQNLDAEQNFQMAVQWVNRPNLDFRGFSGRVASGKIKPKDKVRILPSGKMSKVKRIVTFDGDLDEASAGQSVTLTLEDDLECSRGEVITNSDAPLEVANQFNATLIWMDEKALKPGRSYYLKIGAQTVLATISEPKYQTDINSLERLAAQTLELNEIGVCVVTTDRFIPFSSYTDNRNLVLYNHRQNNKCNSVLDLLILP